MGASDHTDSESADGVEGSSRRPVGSVTDAGEIVTTDSAGRSGVDRRSSLGPKLLAVVVAVGLGFGASLISATLIFGLVGILDVLSIPLPQSPIALVGIELVVGQLLVMGGLSVTYLWATGRSVSFLRIGVPSALQVLVILLAPFVVFVLTVGVNVIGFALGVESSPHALTEVQTLNPSFYLLLVPFMLLIVGPFEELLYRGVIQSRLRESFGPLAAITAASVVFALIHLPAYGLGGGSVLSIGLSLTAIFVGSLVFGGLYEWTGNLTVVALVHGLYNSIQLVLLYIVTVYEEELMELAEPAALVVGL